MVYDIIIGRNKSDTEKYGREGTILLARQYVKMGQTTSLSNKIYMDVAKAHIVFVAGKRGSGKSYTMGSIAEGAVMLPPEIGKNLSFILLDTMGIYWTMKYPNIKDKHLLEEWNIESKGLDIIIFTPHGFYNEYKKQGIPTDKPFALRTSELQSQDWFLTFELQENDPLAVFIERTIFLLKAKVPNYGIDDIVKEIKASSERDDLKNAAINRFLNAKAWGVFEKEGTKIDELAIPGKITVLDVSPYATMPDGWKIKSLVVGIVAQKMFNERMLARKTEEYNMIKQLTTFGSVQDTKDHKPLIWLVIDEAHEFLPVTGTTAASKALITILREGRQPGISLILATQQPGKIHTDVMTQSDIILAHRLTSRLDIDALKMLSASYMEKGIDQHLRILPRVPGASLIIDDANERILSTRMRPRSTWHGGEAPIAIKKKRELF